MRKTIYFFVAMAVFCLMFGNLVLGDIGVTRSSDANINVNVSSQVSIEVDNSDTGDGANITRVDATLPAGMTFVSGTESTSVSEATFSNTSNVLTWNNSLGIIGNGSVESFSFNINASSFGSWNIEVKTYNESGTYDTNITVNVTDNLSPTISIVSPQSVDWTNSTKKSIEINVTSKDNGVLGTMTFRLYNSSQSLVNSTSFISGQGYVNWSLSSEGIYYYNLSVSDSYGNTASSETKRYKYDVTAPSLTLSKTEHDEGSLEVTIGTAEDLNGACSSSRGSVGGTGRSQYINLTGADCETYYTFNVSCTDFAGNIGWVWANYTTDDCSDVESRSDTTTTTATSNNESQINYWTNTYSYDTKDLSEQPLTNRELRAKERVKLKIKNETHHVGVIQLTQVSATINISSTPQQAIFAIGDVKRFELNSDGYYDLLIVLNDIKDNKAYLNISYINEKIGGLDVSEKDSTGIISASLESLGKISLATWIVILGIIIGALFAGYFGWKKYEEHKVKNGVKILG